MDDFPKSLFVAGESLITSANEFNDFVDDSTHLFLMQPNPEGGKENFKPTTGSERRRIKRQTVKSPKSTQTIESLKSTRSTEPPKTSDNAPRRLRRWIEKHCPQLLREMGRPAKLDPFNIDTANHHPIKINPRPYSPVDLQKIKDFIDENVKNGIISESDSPWSFPIVLAAKPDGGTRVCVDYRALNEITRKDAHPLPRIDESLLRFHGMRYFSHIDLVPVIGKSSWTKHLDRRLHSHLVTVIMS